jgi:isopentenyl-diphosphate delta-isomerase
MTLVELVNADGTPLGAATVDEAHQSPGLLHRAFSVFLRDEAGRVLLQQRAAVKTRFPLRWGNTCCGHPGPGEDLAGAAARRLREEVGVDGVPLIELGVYSYYAEDPATGRVEYEYDHVLVGDVPADLAVLADPDEVADLRWTSVDELQAAMGADPRSYAPWLPGVTGVLVAATPASSPRSSGSPTEASSPRTAGSLTEASPPRTAGSLTESSPPRPAPSPTRAPSPRSAPSPTPASSSGEARERWGGG